ncbi:MAG: hypothetical protein JWR68_3320 [Polaromonas sp.]|nr:hypothetical protein [Polaromonas sp.]
MQLSASATAQPNTRYEVNAAGPIDLTLPTNPAVGDFVSLRGVSNTAWRIVPGQITGAAGTSPVPTAVITTNLSGNVAPATAASWTPRMPQRQWHWVASDEDGSVLVASDIPGNLYVSLDGGVTWNVGNSPPDQVWISVAIRRSTNASGVRQLTLLAVAFQGGMYRSTDGGVTWTQFTTTDPAVNLNNQDWESVTMNPTGQIIAGAILNGPIYHSANGGANWAAATLEGSTTPLVRGWRGVASSADGSVMVAVGEEGDGQIFVSTTAGRTWTPRAVSIGGTTLFNGWYRVAVSGDGNTIAIAGRFNSGMYISRDRGLTWSQAATPVGDYTAISMSPDGQVIGATITNGVNNPTTGSVQLSRDGGATFAPVAMPGTQTNWRAIAMSADANKFIVAAGTFTQLAGQLYTSLGNRTSFGSGSIGGGQNDSVEVRYEGNARYSVRTSAGGPFTIR